MEKSFDDLTPEEVQSLRSTLEFQKAADLTQGGGAVRETFARILGGKIEKQEKVLLVAQGDSWFDYLPGLDLIYWLQKEHGYHIENFASAGDTMENMVYGTKYSESDWRRYPCRMNDVVAAISKLRPKAVLFSAVGNDFAGPELDSYYNHADSGLPAERQDYMDRMFNEFFFNGYCHFVTSVCQAVGKKPGEEGAPMVISHTYANAIPDGRAVINVGGYRFLGPWLRPTYTRKGLTDFGETIEYVKSLIAKFAGMLEKVKTKYPKNFDYVDFRPLVGGIPDWANELHLKNNAYRKCAVEMAAKLKSHGVG